MRAALLYQKEDLRLETVPDPSITDGEILLRTRSASICGTDLRMLKHGHAHATPDSPLILGHEMAGEIALVGSKVKRFRPGQRVCVAPNYTLAPNRMVIAGAGHLDTNYRALGIHDHGSFAEYVRLPEEAVRQGNVFPLPDHLSYAAAALVEPLACVYNAFEKAATGPGDTVLIIGAGPIGLMHAKISKLAGASLVIINDPNSDRLAMARAIDPSFVSVSGDPGEELNRLTGGAGADVVITACPVASMQTRSVELAAVHGRIIFFGGLPKGASLVPIDTNLIHYKQLLVTGTTRQSLGHFQRVLDLISSGVLTVEDLITSTHPLEQITTAFAAASAGRGLKASIAFPG